MQNNSISNQPSHNMEWSSRITVGRDYLCENAPGQHSCNTSGNTVSDLSNLGIVSYVTIAFKQLTQKI